MVDATLLKFYKSSNGSLGGDITATEITSGTTNNLFTNITRAQQVAGGDHYLCMYMKNTSTEEMRNVAFWLTQDTPTPLTTVKWATEAAPNVYSYHPYEPFNGSSDFIDVADDPTLDLSAFTVACWAKTSADYSGAVGALVNKGGFGSDVGGENLNYGLWFDTTNKVKGGFEDASGTDRDILCPFATNGGDWHHYAVTYDGSSVLRLYVDGDRVGSLGTSLTPETNAHPLTIGKNSRAADRYFNGSIDEVRVWNIALTWDDIIALRNVGHALEIDNIVYSNKFGVNNGSRIAQTIASITTPPVGAVWQTVGSQPSEANIGRLGPDAYRPIWLWWHWDASPPDTTNDRAIFNFRFEITSTGTGTGGQTGGGGGGGSGGNPPPAPTDYKIAVTGDWGCESETDDVVDQINDGDYGLTIGVGDNSYDSSASCFFNAIKPIDDNQGATGTRFESAYGNHEYEEDSGIGPYKTHFGNNKTYFSFDYQNVHVLIIDTNIDIDEGSNQYDFVVNDLEAQASRNNIDWIFVSMHHPWLGARDHTINEFDQVETYFDLFLEHGVNLVLVGHNHNWQRTYPIKRNGSGASKVINGGGPYTVGDPNPWLIHVVSGAGGHDHPGTLYSISDSPSYNAYANNSNNGILSIEASNGGQTLTCKFINTDGDIKHSWVMQK